MQHEYDKLSFRKQMRSVRGGQATRDDSPVTLWMPRVRPCRWDGSSYQIILANLQTWDSLEEQEEDADTFCGWQSGVDTEWDVM